MTTFRTDAVQVRVPATSANLGPGFDALALALALHDDVVVRVTDSGLGISITGSGADLPRDESHLVVQAMRAAFDRLGGQPSGLDLRCTNRIPHARGLGSSAAAIVAGVTAANALVADDTSRLTAADVLALAAELEGHPDNVAACALGGLTIAWTDGGVARAVRRDVDASITPVVFIPPFEASTKQARGLLPATVPHGDAAFAAGRSALLVAALTGSSDSLFAATEDRLHQSYRAPAMPETAQLVAELRAAGIAAVVPGAGPTVLAFSRTPDEARAALSVAPDGWQSESLAVEPRGAHLR